MILHRVKWAILGRVFQKPGPVWFHRRVLNRLEQDARTGPSFRSEYIGAVIVGLLLLVTLCGPLNIVQDPIALVVMLFSGVSVLGGLRDKMPGPWFSATGYRRKYDLAAEAVRARLTAHERMQVEHMEQGLLS